MRYFFATLSLLSFLNAASAQQKANTLTPKEIADGWILLFDGETTYGWKRHFPGKDLPTVTDNALDLGQSAMKIRSTSPFEEFEMRFECQSASDRATVGLEVIDRAVKPFTAVSFGKREAWTPIAVRVEGGKIEYDVAGQKRSQAWQGLAEVVFAQDPGANLKIRNLRLKPINAKPIFNGKDLTGWKKFEGDKKRAKSDFTVTKDGWLNVKNGPGDLQTDGKYGDFILQLDCISNGKHLNSGIFFRCRDNEYQNGYEAQIRNEFKPEATQEYILEEYDPKTNKLTGKKKEKFTAVDYGTGAIYRRQPARKQMSKDGEWFAMTIVAHGNHFATWVNGVQVADWSDNRPPSDNARTGFRRESGHISIQGHDPTTDLSFRNFRIVELAKKANK